MKAAERRERARRALAAVGLTDREEHHPNQLSGGQQQRVAIARALVNEPSLLLADEPTGNLDTTTSHEVMEVFARLRAERGITIVVITHERDIAAWGTRTIDFRDGVVVAGPAANAEPTERRLPDDAARRDFLGTSCDSPTRSSHPWPSCVRPHFAPCTRRSTSRSRR